MEKLISRKEAAKLLGISIATLDAARNSGLISYVQYVQNGCVYFTDAGLQEYIAKCTHRAKPVEKSATYRKLRTPPQQCSLTADDGASLPLEWCMATGGVVHRAAMLRTTRGCPCVCAWIHPQSGWYRRCR